VFMSVCLLVTQKRVRRLPANFQGSSRSSRGRLKAQKFEAVMSRGQKIYTFCLSEQAYWAYYVKP